jgi:hypothetical protein
MDLDEIKAETKRLSPLAHIATVGADGKPDVVPVYPAWEGDTPTSSCCARPSGWARSRYSLRHVGYTIPPQADAGWIGEAGPGPSYLDPGSGGPDNDFTNRNTS